MDGMDGAERAEDGEQKGTAESYAHLLWGACKILRAWIKAGDDRTIGRKGPHAEKWLAYWTQDRRVRLQEIQAIYSPNNPVWYDPVEVALMDEEARSYILEEFRWRCSALHPHPGIAYPAGIASTASFGVPRIESEHAASSNKEADVANARVIAWTQRLFAAMAATVDVNVNETRGRRDQ